MKRREFITLHTADAMTDYRSVILTCRSLRMFNVLNSIDFSYYGTIACNGAPG
jgi:hypothetical protein